MKKALSLFCLAILAILQPATTLAQWQQSTACPGWNNPNNFNTSSTDNYYSGELGDKASPGVPEGQFNVMTGTTGMTWSGTVLTPMQMMNSTAYGCYNSANNGVIPDYLNQYAIMTTTSQSSGHPVNRDPNTADHLPFVPTQFNTMDTTPGAVNTNLTRSIRIGDVCANNSNGFSSGSSINYDAGAAALYYNMRVTTDNALMYIYYACVFQSPGHGTQYDPVFIIRVTKQNAAGTWEQISDTLAYMIGATPAQGQGINVSSSYGGYGTLTLAPNYNTNGWHSNNPPNGATATASSASVVYKDWSKIVLNLSNHLYENVRIEIMVSDCYGNAHWGYAYVAGECRPMNIRSSGCLTDTSSNVATLTAPQGMLSYQWAASNMGKSEPATRLNPGGYDEWFTFRDLTTDSSSNNSYTAQYDDFRVQYDPHAVGQLNPIDSVGKSQTFRCRMTTALDPDKPYSTYLYMNIYNKTRLLAIPNDSTMGTVSGGGVFCHDDLGTMTISATPFNNYHFVQWNDGDRNATRDIALTRDTTFIAYFAPNGSLTEEVNIRTCTGQTLRMEINNATHTATVIGYVGQCVGGLTVPAWFSIDDVRYTVTAVGPRAFENCTGLESVTLPVTITLVDEEAFKGCGGLLKVDMK